MYVGKQRVSTATYASVNISIELLVEGEKSLGGRRSSLQPWFFSMVVVSNSTTTTVVVVVQCVNFWRINGVGMRM